MKYKGYFYDMVPFGSETHKALRMQLGDAGAEEVLRRYPLTRCHDCGVAEGGYHHAGCDDEECPVCGLQAISCDTHIGHLNEEDIVVRGEMADA